MPSRTRLLRFGIGTAAGLALIAALQGCGPQCGNEVLDEVVSPDGRLTAIVFARNCGATTGPNLQVSIVPRGSRPEAAGNVLVMDSAPPYSARWRPAWTGDDQLTLAVPAGARTFTQNPELGAVRISFVRR